MPAGRRLFTLTLLLLLVGAVAARDDEKDEPEKMDDVPAGKVIPMSDVGGHTGAIRSMVFSKDGKKLYTAGLPPCDLYEWDIETGQRTRVWHFPTHLPVLALSPDGKKLALSGSLRTEKGKTSLPVWTLDLASDKLVTHSLPADYFTHCLAYHPSGKGVAVAAGNKLFQLRLADGSIFRELKLDQAIRHLAINPGGSRIAITRTKRDNDTFAPLRIHDITAKGGGKFIDVRSAGAAQPCPAWSSDGTRLACISTGSRPNIQVWFDPRNPKTPDWSLDRNVAEKFILGKINEPGRWTAIGATFLPNSKQDLVTCWHQGGFLRVLRVNLDTKRVTLLPGSFRLQYTFSGKCAMSPNGQYLAVTTNPTYRIAVYDLGTNRPLQWLNRYGDVAKTIGPSIGRPYQVGWTKDGKGFVWNYRKDAPLLGLDLASLHLNRDVDPQTTFNGALTRGWRVEFTSGKSTVLKRPKQKDVTIPLRYINADLTRSFLQEGKRRLLVVHETGERLAIVDPDTGKTLREVGNRYFPIFDLAVSPNGKYVVVAGGSQLLELYSLDRPKYAMLRVLYSKGDWVAWTPQGYYAGTPGGEKLIGWKVITDPDRLAAFYSADRFHKKFRQPEVIKNLLAAGSVQAALQVVGATQAKVDDLLPPTVHILDARPDSANPRRYLIKAEAIPGSAKQPIEGMRLWLDGKLLPDKPKTLARSASGKASVAEWIVEEMPEGKSALKVVARCQDVNGISAPRPVDVAGKPKEQPKLHVVAVGLNYAHDTDLKLNCAVNDAQAIAEAFPKNCVGPTHQFKEKAAPIVLLDDKATAKAITDVLVKLKKDVKRHDLVVFFYAGHGEREKDEFYLLTAGAKTGDLKGTALSGTTLREALKEVQGQVLLVLDACHSGHAGKALRGASPVADEASRSLADEECAVTLLAAAMSHERALEEKGGKHGFFTEALLATLKASASVAHNKYDGQQYVTHLASDVLDEVQHRSKDRQHPFLSIPWTIEPFPIRRVR